MTSDFDYLEDPSEEEATEEPFETFTLELKLGNAAMQTGADVAEALRFVAERAEAGHEDGKVRDYNGNTVGRFNFNR